MYTVSSIELEGQVFITCFVPAEPSFLNLFVCGFLVFYSSFDSELISPEDLLRACSIWEKFDVYACSCIFSKYNYFHNYSCTVTSVFLKCGLI